MTSLPLPLSPANVTVTSLTATDRKIRSNRRIVGEVITGSSTIGDAGLRAGTAASVRRWRQRGATSATIAAASVGSG